jgi:tRNA pseudouridine38-40 synthase
MVTKLTLAYEGTRFAGWARQPGQRTVQEELERALGTILGEPVPSKVAGRTDAGVHAWAQVVSYEHEAIDPRRLNALLPDDVAVRSSEPMDDGFDARASATARSYCYRVLNSRSRNPFERGRAFHVPRRLDRAALLACAQAIPGLRDFTAFTPTETHHKRFEREVLSAEWRESGELLEFHIAADSFMRQMNRVLVGTMLEVATGSRSVEQFTALLAGAPRSQAGATAPAHGLYLASVAYASSPARPG